MSGTALVMAGLTAGDPAAAQFFEAGRPVLTGNGNLFYSGGETEELAETLASVIVALLVLAGDEDGWDCCDEDDYWDDDEFGIRVTKTQVDVGLGVALVQGLVVGGRWLVKSDANNDDIQALWGAGPEVVYFGRNGYAVQPFIGAGYFFARGRANRTQDNALRQGMVWQVRSGVHLSGDKGGMIIQASFQSDRLHSVGGDPFASKTLGLGVGFSLALD